MPTAMDFVPLLLSPSSDTDSVSAALPSWTLTRAIHMLRLTVADASLRAREEARYQRHDANEHWHTLGRARGYQKVASVLRCWTHPEERTEVLAALEVQVKKARVYAQHATTDKTIDFYAAYSWTLDWASAQVRELCATLD